LLGVAEMSGDIVNTKLVHSISLIADIGQVSVLEVVVFVMMVTVGSVAVSKIIIMMFVMVVFMHYGQRHDTDS
jgi:hypothetical protein